MHDFLTVSEAAAELGVDAWRVRRLYEDGTLPDPPRLARARAIARSDLSAITDALRDRGWLPESQEQSA